MDTLTASDGDQPRTVTLAQAAQLLGVSVPTVRRRVKQGALAARKVDGPNGPEYRVLLEQGIQHPTVVNGSAAHPPNGHRAQRQGGRREHPDDRVDLSSLTALVDKLTQQNLELAGRVGFYQAQLAAKDDQIRALMAPKGDPMTAGDPMSGNAPAGSAPRWPEESAPTESAPSRPWWRLWR